jgi:hypothetical protein
MIGKIARVPLREVWKHEALDLTKWLQDNIDVLNDVLGMSLSNAQREQSAGDFSVDLVAEDDASGLVVIENQLERSDHAHLGKLITYLTAIGAKTGIWIVADPRPEHVAAITWLNESSATSFYMLKIEGVRIGESPPAPLLTLIVGPSEEGRVVGETKKVLAERHELFQKFWAELLNRAKGKTRLHEGKSPSGRNTLGASAGKPGFEFKYWIAEHEGSVFLAIELRTQPEEETKDVFDTLAKYRDAIEKDFGGPVVWDCLEGRRVCRIEKIITIGGYRDETKWGEIQDAMIDAMIRLERALKPHIAKLQL